MATERHKPGKDGLLEDGVSSYPADAHDISTFASARQSLSRMPAPVLHHSGNPHERLFIAAFDGTGNDADKDPAHRTNVAEIRDQVRLLNGDGNDHIRAEYVRGVGTEANPIVRAFDGASGYTYEQRLEEMYAKLIREAAGWLKADPNAQIRIADIGFSRGAEQAAGFARLVHERGIQDWTGIRHSVDAHGHAVVEYSKPPLVPPGRIAQAVGLFDPVGTGEPRHHDRRLPPSVISGFQITAEDEHRGLFKSTSDIDQGQTPDGRFLGVRCAGAHSDVGGGYHRNGLSIRSGNLMIDYLNALSDTPFLHKRAEPDAPGMNVVHRSEEGMLLYRLWRKVDRQQPEGVVEILAPPALCRNHVDCRNAEPRDESLAAGFEYRNVAIGAVPREVRSANLPLRPDATHPGHAEYPLLLQSVSAVARLEATLERPRDLSSDRLAASMAVTARAAGLHSIDEIMLGARGEHAFAVEGAPGSPARRWARIETGIAIATPVGTSLRQLDGLQQEQVHDATRKQSPHPSLVAHPEPAPAMAR